jgi:hypothetical protein
MPRGRTNALKAGLTRLPPFFVRQRSQMHSITMFGGYRDARVRAIICNVIRSRSGGRRVATDLRIRNPLVDNLPGVMSKFSNDCIMPPRGSSNSMFRLGHG